jgi:putative SOS response-associated peptidase YedK
MCGRGSLTINEKQLELKFGKEFYSEDLERYHPLPNYNIAPSHRMPVIKAASDHFDCMRWGLIPFWAKDMKIGYKMINARKETILQKNAFKKAAINQRCVVPFDGFYEWKRNTDGTKTPYRIGIPNFEVFLIAGLWEEWKSPDGEQILSFTLITQKPIDQIAHIHDRMPALIMPGEEHTWLDLSIAPQEALDSIRPLAASEIDYHEVSSKVGNVRNNTPDLIQKVTD